MEKGRKQISQILMENGLISPAQLKEALEEQQKTRAFLGEIFLKKGWIKEKDLLEVLSEQFDIPLKSIKNKYIDWNFVKQFSSTLILDYKCFPIRKDDWSITFGLTNPLDSRVMQKAEEEARGLKVKFVLVTQEEINEAINRYQQYLRAEISKQFK